MASIQKNSLADHGAALRVPASIERARRDLLMWLGEDGHNVPNEDAVRVWTAEGWAVALPGDWIVLSSSGAFHVATSPRRMQA